VIILKTKTYSIRDRMPEWILSSGLVVWGIMILLTPGLFDSNFYAQFIAVMSQDLWGFATICLGTFRLLALLINGLWRPTAHLRALGAVGGTLIWGSLLSVSLINSAARAPGIGIFGMLLAFEFMALWWSAGDAKVADTAAKSKREINGL